MTHACQPNAAALQDAAATGALPAAAALNATVVALAALLVAAAVSATIVAPAAPIAYPVSHALPFAELLLPHALSGRAPHPTSAALG